MCYFNIYIITKYYTLERKHEMWYVLLMFPDIY